MKQPIRRPKSYAVLPLIALLAVRVCSGQSSVLVLDNLWNIDTVQHSSSRIGFGRDINDVVAWFGQGFHTGNDPGGYYLEEATLAFENAFGQPTAFTLEIYDTTTVLAPNVSLGLMTGSSDPDTRGNYSYLTENLLLQPNSDYVMVVKATGTVRVQNDEYLWFRAASTSITAAEGWQATGMWAWIEQRGFGPPNNPVHRWFSAYQGNYPPAAFSMTVTTIPEPASLTLSIVGLLGLSCRARFWRRWCCRR